jgi:hypothetical protein
LLIRDFLGEEVLVDFLLDQFQHAFNFFWSHKELSGYMNILVVTVDKLWVKMSATVRNYNTERSS